MTALYRQHRRIAKAKDDNDVDCARQGSLQTRGKGRWKLHCAAANIRGKGETRMTSQRSIKREGGQGQYGEARAEQLEMRGGQAWPAERGD